MWVDIGCNKNEFEKDVRRIPEINDFFFVSLAFLHFYLSTVKKAAKLAVKVASIKTMKSQ